MLSGIHFLLTYTCPFECDHCFLFCGPRAEGTFTLRQMEQVLDEAVKIKSVKWIYFEGGEPFLYYPLMLEGIRRARKRGFKTGIVTNAYWATSSEDVAVWLQPLKELAIDDLSISDDDFHYSEQHNNLAKNALAAAKKLDLPVGAICIDKPSVRTRNLLSAAKGRPIIGGGVRFRGRAAEKLTADLPKTKWEKLTECPDENMADPGRVHIDAYGNVHLCQGLCIGNCWKTPLSEIIAKYDPSRHPICGPLLKGGPAALVKQHGTQHENSYVDECHFCYHTRRKLLESFPDCLCPQQVYGVSEQ